MSSQKFPRKQYETPMHPWKESRIKTEREMIKKYGLKNHKEVWKAKTYLGKHREQARELLAKLGTASPQAKKESDQLLLHLSRMGIVAMGASLDDVLALDTESVLSRRLQTIVYLKGFSSTPYQARQLISHGHVAVSGRKVTIPSYMVAKDEEGQIEYTIRSPLNELSHPARPKGDVYKTEPAAPLKAPSEVKPAAVVLPKQEPAAIVAPPSQPAAVVPVPSQSTEISPAPAAEKPAEEKPAKPAEKPKEHVKKEKKTEGV
ncbi:MAG TPA: 30S ribosomal protein S4 [Candidatus Thermoplasmatota archaeon]|nr:30S ribosomal protein S4 [Candidatus Thermoplasmatota archaeon]